MNLLTPDQSDYFCFDTNMYVLNEHPWEIEEVRQEFRQHGMLISAPANLNPSVGSVHFYHGEGPIWSNLGFRRWGHPDYTTFDTNIYKRWYGYYIAWRKTLNTRVQGESGNMMYTVMRYFAPKVEDISAREYLNEMLNVIRSFIIVTQLVHYSSYPVHIPSLILHILFSITNDANCSSTPWRI